MPLSKQAKALYEAALRRKGLQPGKALRQDPRKFVGPIEMERDIRPSSNLKYYPDMDRYEQIAYETKWIPKRTYYNDMGRHQDLYEELSRPNDYISSDPFWQEYSKHYNSRSYAPKYIKDRWIHGRDYDDNMLTYSYPEYHYPSQYGDAYWNKMNRGLTRQGELELEARADEMIENMYKDYLRNMYEGKIPMRKGYSAEDLAEYMEPGYYVKR